MLLPTWVPFSVKESVSYWYSAEIFHQNFTSRGPVTTVSIQLLWLWSIAPEAAASTPSRLGEGARKPDHGRSPPVVQTRPGVSMATSKVVGCNTVTTAVREVALPRLLVTTQLY